MKANLIPGLTSVTFRKLDCRRIVELARDAGLSAIEWGGDVHVPPGDRKTAMEIGRLTREAGLDVSSYGSYFRIGTGGKPHAFEDVLLTAETLKAPVIRVWAGTKGSNDTTPEERRLMVSECRSIAEAAAKRDIRIAFEFHNGTLTDTNESAVELLDAIGHPGVGTYWQPPSGVSLDYCVSGLRMLRPYLVNIHAYSVDEESGTRLPLSGHEQKWQAILRELRLFGGKRYVLLEFVRDDSPDMLFPDARTLKRWLRDEPADED